MNKLQTGEFYGTHYQKSVLDNLIITDTEYTHSKVDWHYHENPYFTYLLTGKLFESNKKESYHLESGSLLFHNWQDAHYNTKPPLYTRGFHIELNQKWFSNFDLSITDLEGSIHLKNPVIKNLIHQVFYETKINDEYSNLSIESSLLAIFTILKSNQDNISSKPNWVIKLQELLFEENVEYSLSSLSSHLGIHPVHLSRAFSRYFGTSFGRYMRLLKVNKAVRLIISGKHSMTEICYLCGFYDQSHFITNFKRIHDTTPSKFLAHMPLC